MEMRKGKEKKCIAKRKWATKMEEKKDKGRGEEKRKRIRIRKEAKVK